MNILAFTTLSPIPGFIQDNDIVLQLYQQYQDRYPDTRIHVVRLVPYCNQLMARLRSTWKNNYEAKQLGRFNHLGLEVMIMPFYCYNTKGTPSEFLSKRSWALNKRRVLEHCGQNTIDLVHANFISFDGDIARAAARDLDAPYVISTQIESQRYDTEKQRKKSQPILDEASGVTSSNANTRRAIRDYFGIESQLIPYGIDDLFHESECDSREINRTQPLRILTVCRLLELKNIDILLRAIKDVSAEIPCDLMVVGDGPEREKLEQLSKDLGLNDRVQFAGRVDRERVRTEMLNHDLFVMPSAPETYGLVYAEAMTLGMPVVCAEGNGIFGYFEQGKEGFAVPARDVPSIVEIIKTLHNDRELLAKMSDDASRLAAGFTWGAVCSLYHGVFQQAVGS